MTIAPEDRNRILDLLAAAEAAVETRGTAMERVQR